MILTQEEVAEHTSTSRNYIKGWKMVNMMLK